MKTYGLWGALVIATGCAEAGNNINTPTPVVGCGDGAACPAGQQCLNGRCQPAAVFECHGDADCDSGEHCVEGECIPDQCTEGETKPCHTDCGDGMRTCRDGAFRNCNAPAPIQEICGNGRDDDCDGEIDPEAMCGRCSDGAERPCDTACGNGVERCLGERWQGCTAPRPRQFEVCGDGVDDDCDGEIDEGCDGCADGQTRPCETECGEGVETCREATFRDCTAPAPIDELCDGRDNNCDGRVDEEITRDCGDACGAGTETCENGEWVGCTAPEDCACSADTVDDQVCGQCGARHRQCQQGAWGPWSECDQDQAACTPGEPEDARCEGCGTRRRTCTAACEWGEWQACVSQGACAPGDTESERCGAGCGSRSRTCTDACGWSDWSECQGGDLPPGETACEPGSTDEEPCGRCGTRRRVCGNDCRFGDFGACSDEGVCEPGEDEGQACGGNCQAQIRVCNDQCQWGGWGECQGGGLCEPDAVDRRACDACGEQTRTCTQACIWGEWSDCQGGGTCVPGDAQRQACGMSEVGLCQLGAQTRTCDERCEWRDWERCRGNVDPVAEICGDDVDQDCDGEDLRLPDDWEPNDSCETCRMIAEEPDPNVFVDATIDSADDAEDYYCFDAQDGFSVPGFRESIIVELTNVPNGADFDVFLYKGQAACEARTSLESGTNPGSADERLEWPEVLNQDDTGRYIVEVKRFLGQSCERPYHLVVNGLN